MTRNYLVVAIAALGFAGLTGCGHAAVEVTPPVVAPPPPPVVAEVVTAPPPPKLSATCDGVIMPAGHFKFPHEVEFDTGKASIKSTPTTSAILQCLVDFMNNNKMVTKFQVDGHTDNAGDPAQNLQLSQARAEAVLAFMAAHGVENNRLSAKGWGPQKPLAPNDTPDHMAMNRRVEFWIHELNGQQATKDSIAIAMNPPAATAVVTTAAPAIGVGVAVPTVAVPTVGVGVAVPTATVAVPTGVAIGVGTAPAGAPAGKKK